MWAFVIRRLLINIPVFLGVILFVMAVLRIHDPVTSYLSKQSSAEKMALVRQRFGLDRPFVVQYGDFLWRLVRLDFQERSWYHETESVGALLRSRIVPSLKIGLPSLVLTTLISIGVSLVSALNRGGWIDKTLVILAVLGMSISFLVYVVLGQYWGAFLLNQSLGRELFAVTGYEPGLIDWPRYCLLPVMINVIVAIGYDTRYYRAAMVEESARDYITTARAKGVGRARVMFAHVLPNALVPIITRIMITVPFLVAGSILLEMQFQIPGMGRELIQAIEHADFPVIQAFTAVLAGLFLLTNVMTDILYAAVDPRIRLE